MQHVTTSPPTNKMPTSPNNLRKLPPFPKPSRPIPASWADDVDSPVDTRRHHHITSFGNQSKLQNPPFVNRSSPSTSPDNSMSSEVGAQGNNTRWKLTGQGQLVDSEAAAYLADDLVRLQIANGSADEIAGAQSKAAPKSTIVRLQESGLLESSDASLESGSPPTSDQHLSLPNHNRGSSTDSTSSQVAPSSNFGLKVSEGHNHRDRPHSYSGGLSTADLRRLQTAPEPEQARGAGVHEKSGQPEQTTFPSLSSYSRQQGNHQVGNPDDLQVDYGVQQRQFQPITVDTRVTGPNANNYRQPPQRSFNPQTGGATSGTTNMSYTGQPSGVSLGSNQTVFENPTVARVQQHHGAFRNGHQHAGSDPAHLREAAAAAILNSGMPAFAPGMYPITAPPGVGIYPGQFFSPQEGFAPSVAQIMAAARMQPQFTQPYGMGLPMLQQNPTGSNSGSAQSPTNVAVDPSGNGPSANNRKLGLYKTELCRSWEEKGTCRYGPKCQFAHGEDEIRRVSRHPKYKTEICRTFWVSGSCPYGKRCCFIHTELPPSGTPPDVDGTQPPRVTPDTSAMSDRDSNDGQVSLLQRISAKRTQETSPASSTGETTPSTAYPTPTATMNPRRPLRVDTASLDHPALKHQNKSAYPTFAPNAAGSLFQPEDKAGNRSPGPVTAGPDLRRMEFPGFSQSKANNRSSNSSVRHSFNGTEVVNLGLNSPTPPSGNSSPFTTPAPEPAPPSRQLGHARSGSAGNWGNLPRNVTLQGPQTAAPGNEPRANVPWLSAVDGPGTGARW